MTFTAKIGRNVIFKVTTLDGPLSKEQLKTCSVMDLVDDLKLVYLNEDAFEDVLNLKGVSLDNSLGDDSHVPMEIDLNKAKAFYRDETPFGFICAMLGYSKFDADGQCDDDDSWRDIETDVWFQGIDSVIIQKALGSTGRYMCSCGSVYSAINALDLVLKRVSGHHQHKECGDASSARELFTSNETLDGLSHLILYVLDSNDLLEHGSSVSSAWLLPEGTLLSILVDLFKKEQ